MSLWELPLCILIALAVLYVQAVVIQLSALSALREAILTRWDALICVEKMVLSQFLERSRVAASCPPTMQEELMRLHTRLGGHLQPEDPQAREILRVSKQAIENAVSCVRPALEEEASRLGMARHWNALMMRRLNAKGELEEAVRSYEFRRCALRMTGLVAWFGYKTYSAVGSSLNVR
jgi:hypothetical protein